MLEALVNLVIFHTDQQRFDSLGCNGNHYADTPNIDEIAREGRRYTRHFSSNPVCMPSRASLLSGLYPGRNGVWSNGVSLPRREHVIENEHTRRINSRMPGLVPHVATLADILADAGYRTHSVGKMHLTPTEASVAYGLPESRDFWEGEARRDWNGPYCGFQSVDLSLHHGDMVSGHYRYYLEDRYPHVVENLQADREDPTRRHSRRPEVEGLPADLSESAIPAEAHHSTWCADKAVEFLSRQTGDDSPFFLWVGFPDPHHPWMPPSEAARAFIGHGAEPPVAFHDRCATPTIRGLLGSSPQDLAASGATEKVATIIREYTNAQVHLIDRGVGRVVAALKERGVYDDTIIVFTSDHGDFLGDYGLIRKAGVPSRPLCHVAFLLRIPGEPAGRTINHPMSNVDVVPTLVSALGLDVGSKLEGLDGRSVLVDPPDGHLAMIQTFGTESSLSFSVLDERYRMTYYPRTGERELYDHRNDPFEQENLTGSAAARTTEKDLYAALLKRTVDSVHPISGHLSPW